MSASQACLPSLIGGN